MRTCCQAARPLHVRGAIAPLLLACAPSRFAPPTALPRGGRLLASAAATAPSSPQPSLYAPFIELALEIFDEFGLELEPYPVGEGLKSAATTTGGGKRVTDVTLTTRAYHTDVLRQIRLVHIEGGSALQVLNFCIFPSLEYGLPTFSADLVSLPGGHLVALDCQPNGPASVDAYAAGGGLSAAFERHRGALPDGGSIPSAAQEFFSPCFLWSRLPRDASGDAALGTQALAAFDDYLRAYLELCAATPPLTAPAERASVEAAQLSYATYRIENDPARPMLTRLFGAPFCERLIRHVLFDLPRVLGHGRDEAGGEAGGEEGGSGEGGGGAAAAAAS